MLRTGSARRALRALGLLLVGCVLVACGSEEPPAAAVPALADRLERVDAAITDDRPDRARRAVEELVDEATRARMEGSITAEQADRILRAAGRLLERLGTTGDHESEDSSDPSPPSPPVDAPEGEGEEPEGDGDGAAGHQGDGEPDEDDNEGEGHGED